MSEEKRCVMCNTPIASSADACAPCIEYAMSVALDVHAAYYKRPGLGDRVASVTAALGIPECGGCGKRRAAMNVIDANGPLAKVFVGLIKAAINPDEVLEEEAKNGKR